MLERDQEIRELYAQPQHTAASLARAYGLSEPRIRQIVAGVEKDRKSRERRPVSEAHKRLGLKIYNHRWDNQLTKKAVADKLGWSVSKLHNLEQGLIDPTLTDLQDIATFMKLELGEVLKNVFSRH